MYKFTVAIPTYNSSSYLKQCIHGFKNSKFVDEIIVGDDFSDIDEQSQIIEIIKDAKDKIDCDIKLLTNQKNLGAFQNKYKLISHARNEWVYQIDSDNIPFKNIDSVIKEVIKDSGREKFIYYPSKLIQFRKYKLISKFMSYFNKKYRVTFSKKILNFDITMTKNAILENIKYEKEKKASKELSFPELKSKYLKEKHIFWVLNCGNFIVNKKLFLSSMKEGLDYDREILSMDAVVFSYLWLKNGGVIKILPSLAHYHRKRMDSVSFHEKDASIISRKILTEKLLNLI